MVWLKGGAIVVLFSATFCYSGHLDFLVRLRGGAILCYFLLFWGQPHQQLEKTFSVFCENKQKPPPFFFDVYERHIHLTKKIFFVGVFFCDQR